MDRKHQRKLVNLIINPRYQLKYILWTGLTGLTLTAINASIFYTYIRENYQVLVDLSPMEDEVKAQLYRELHQVVWLLFGFSVLFIIGVSILGLFLSHRTAGPMYHFKRVFREIIEGKRESRIRLRPNDDFRDVAELCNQMIDHLQKKP